MNKCTFGFHTWDFIAVDTTFYTTTRSADISADKRWTIKYYQCTKCAKKKSTTDAKNHSGVKLAQDLWTEKGMLYKSSRLLSELNNVYTYQTGQVIPFSTVKGGNNEH